MFNGLLDAALHTLGHGNNKNYLFDRYSTTRLVGSNTPVWVDTTQKWVLYNNIPELRAVINRYANMIASAKPVVKNMNGEVVPEGQQWIFDLLHRPNALQTWSRMTYMLAVNKCVTANAVVYMPKGSMGNVQSLTPLAYNDIQIVPTGKGLKQTTLEGFIKEFKIKKDYSGSFETFDPAEVLYISDPDGINLFDTKSRIEALKYPLSNLAAGYRKRNVLLDNLFTLGVLKANSTDGISALPIESEDIEDMRKDMKQRHDGEVIITDKDFGFEPMSFPVKDLMLFEEMTADKEEIIDQYGLNRHMFSAGTSRGSTFSNVEMGERQAYNSTIIPDAKDIYGEITTQTGLEKLGLKLVPSFDHISVLRSDENKAAEALFKRAQAVEKIAEQVALSDDEKRKILKIED